MPLSVEDALSSAGTSLRTACSLLWHLDINRLNPHTDYTLNPQSRIRGYSDAASENLVLTLDDSVWSRPTYASFRRLLDNYTAETGVPEIVSQEERTEELTFLSAIADTPCIQFAHAWLSANGHTSAETIEDFQEVLHHIWFALYRRDASRDSSGFEHVFIGELDDGHVKGLHNFYQVFLEELRGNFNYKGYLDPRGAPSYDPPPPTQQFITIRFDWLGETKPVSSMFVGASPEFEFALYTMLFLSQEQSLDLDLGPYSARIKVYQMAGNIGTAFPELLAVDLDKLAEMDAQTADTPSYQPQQLPNHDSFPALGDEPDPEPEPEPAGAWARPAWGARPEPEAQPARHNAWGQPQESEPDAEQPVSWPSQEAEPSRANGASISVEDALAEAGDSLESALSLLWRLDANRLDPSTDYELNLQTRSRGYSDAADEKLVVSFSDDVWSRPTFGSFKKLLDNYTAETGVPEVVSQDERAEEATFLDAVCETDIAQFAMQWLANHTDVSVESMDDFRELLQDIWFNLYRRDASRDSSGFEHVFIGELDDGCVKGLHNFYQVLTEEVRGNFNYKGYLGIRGSRSYDPPPPNQQLITIRFDWLGESKSASSMFVGVSPEFEVVLYTMLFVTGEESFDVQLGPYTVRIKVYQQAGKIGSAFPDLQAVDLEMLAEAV